MLKQEKSKKIEYVIFGVAGVVIVIYMFFLQYHTPICFDGGMNFTVSRSLAETGKYATDYQQQELFAARIQTGAPVIFPTAILNCLLGINSNNMQIITTIYGVLLSLLIFIVLSKNTNYFIATISTIYLLSLTYYTNVSYLGIGETAMGFFLLLFCVLMSKAEETNKKNYYVTAGLCIGLGYLTKTIFLIIAPAVCLVLLARLILKKSKIKPYFLVLGSALMPVLLFEIYRLTQMGVASFVDWWKYMIMDILGQAGVTDQHTASQVRNMEQFSHHISVFCDHFNISLIMFAIIYILPLVVGIFNYVKNKKIDFLYILLYGIALTYIFWWVVMSPSVKLWPRRILMGYVCIIICLAWSIWILIKELLHNKMISILLSVVVIVVMSIPVANNYKESLVETRAHKKQYDLYIEGSEYLKSLPHDCKFYGISWWENPTISGMSGKKMYDLVYGVDDYNSSYYIEEAIARSSYGIQGTQNMVMAQYDTDIVFQNGGIRIFKINGREQFDNLDLGIKLELVDTNDVTFKFHYSSFEEDHGEINKSVFMAKNEKEVCVELFNSNVDKILLGIVSNKVGTEIKLESLTIKLEDEILYYDNEELYNLLKNSPGTSSISLDEDNKTVIKFDNSTQIFFDIH